MKTCKYQQLAVLIYLLAAISPGLSAQSLGFQITPDHTGQLYFPSMDPPLVHTWSLDLGSRVAFPIIVGNRIFVARKSNGGNSELYALDAQTGNTLWMQPSQGFYGWLGIAYEGGRIFALSDNGDVTAFSPIDGHQIWTAPSVGYYGGLYPLTALNGVLYGGGGEVFAMRESDGTILWTAFVGSAGTTPAVTSEGVYFGYPCQVYKFDLVTGHQIWSFVDGCSGGAGSIPPVYQGRVYLPEVYDYSTTGLALSVADGRVVAGFDTAYMPAFWQNTAFYTEPTAVLGVDIPSSLPKWIQLPPQGESYSCNPIVVNGIVYSATAQGHLFGYMADTGAQVLSANVGHQISCPNDGLFWSPPLTGMTAGNGLLLVPAGNHLVAYQFQNFGHWQFVPVTPCRLVDTRQTHDPIQGGTSQSFIVPQLGGCDIPTSALAYSLNVTVAPHRPLGYLTIWPNGEQQPTVSTMNSPDGRVKANAAIVPAGFQNAVNVYATDTTDVILDINGYFAPPSSGTYEFYPLPPCRIVDTRNLDGPLGGPFLQAQQARDFPILTSTCIPAGVTPSAYSLNVTVVPHPAGQQLGYLTVWPKGHAQPNVSTLNNLTATVVANAAIVPAGTGGDIEVYGYNSTDLLIDINGYFAAPGTGGLSFYPAAPCRVLDTRAVGNGQPFSGTLTPPVNVTNSVCSPPANAQAYALNATVVPSGNLGYLTLWPDGQQIPLVSTLNAVDGYVTSNMAIVPTSNGSVDAYAAGLTQLIVDISGYFAP